MRNNTSETNQLRNKPITYEELKKHSSYDDAWISINSIVYDITDFIPKHPFGDTFKGNLGTECGGVIFFFSYEYKYRNTHYR